MSDELTQAYWDGYNNKEVIQVTSIQEGFDAVRGSIQRLAEHTGRLEARIAKLEPRAGGCMVSGSCILPDGHGGWCKQLDGP